MFLLCPTPVCALHIRRALTSLLFELRSHQQAVLAASLPPVPKLPGSSWVVVYTPVLPRPFAPVCEIWTLPSGWQVTETCKALAKHKTQGVQGTVGRWDALATCDTSQYRLQAGPERYMFLSRGTVYMLVHQLCTVWQCSTHVHTTSLYRDPSSSLIWEKGWQRGVLPGRGQGWGSFRND